jgi:D-beta-D-heptose 7-phosphate kinase/D-beta-D-heptose 1-phosphate adenosyltransferase
MTTSGKIVTVAVLLRKLKALRRSGQKIAFTNGCFDILHYGHTSYLERAKKSGRILVVAVNSDSSVRKLKGAHRPIIVQRERAAVLAALECVDFVVIFSEETPFKLIKAIEPDVLIKGADYQAKDVVGSDIVRARGGRVELIEFIPGLSSSNIMHRIRQSEKG